MNDPADVLHLLLAREGDRAPALPEGLPLGPAITPEPVRSGTRGLELDDPGAGDSPEDMPLPAWGVIAPEGAEGDRLLALIAPLIALREEQQGRPAPIYRVPRGPRPFGIAEAVAWRLERFDSGADLGLSRADYQLILGDLDAVPLAIQEVQSLGGRVGRLTFSDDAGYEVYVEKILRVERAARAPGRALIFTAHDGSRAIDIGNAGLAAPGEAMLRAERASSFLPAEDVLADVQRGAAGLDLLLQRAAAPGPGALFTLSHGVGAPFEGWSSPEAQRAGQGAMAFGVESQLSGSDVAARPFMPDGLWLMFACFSAGTPAASAYAPWLERLAAQKGRPPPEVTRTLSMGAPFIADLPRRALANPRGPLAFVGHVDLAWTYSFRDGDGPSGARAGRFMRVLAGALRGEPVGDAFNELAYFVSEADRTLTGVHAEDAVTRDAAADAAGRERRRALLWMARQDLAGFILLGDPRARLPVAAKAEDEKGSGPTIAGLTPTADPALDTLERAIAALTLGLGSLAEIAAQHGLDPASLHASATTYRHGGRSALAAKG